MDESMSSKEVAISNATVVNTANPTTRWSLKSLRPRNTSIRRHLCGRIKPTPFAEKQLLLLTFTTGMQDALTFPDYHCFASNQTGNSVLLAVSLNRVFSAHAINHEATPPFVTANIGVSLAFFLLGASVTGQIGHHILHPLSRPWIIFSNLIQTAMIFTAAGLQYTYGVELTGKITLAILALLAFASGSQVVVSRSLHMTEISTAMATAAWVDLLVDPALLKSHNRGRDRRALFLITLFVGSFVGAVAYARVSSGFALLISAVGKTVALISFLLNPAESPKPSAVVQTKGPSEVLAGDVSNS